MKRTATIVVIAVMVIGTVGSIPIAGTTTSVEQDAQAVENAPFQMSDENASENATISPGERLSAVVSAQEVEIEGDVEQRAFGLRIAQAASNESKSEVASQQLETVRNRLQNMSEERERLRAAHENNTMSQGEFAARSSRMATEAVNAQEMINQTENETSELPTDLLESHGINASAIEMLKNNASEMSGSEVSQVARQIAGPKMGSQARPDWAGNGGDGIPGNGDGPANEAGNGDAPANQTGNGNAPANETGNGDGPANEAGNGDAPANQTGNGDAPTDDTGNGSAPDNETENGGNDTVDNAGASNGGQGASPVNQ